MTPILVLYNRSGLAHNYHLCQFLRLEGAKSSSYRVTGDLIYQKHLEIRYKKDFTTVTNYMISFVAKNCVEEMQFLISESELSIYVKNATKILGHMSL